MEREFGARPTDERDAIARLRTQAEDQTRAWLRKRGWKETSSTPGCYWMWLKDWDGKTFMVDQSTAARIQEHWDAAADYEQHPEDYPD